LLPKSISHIKAIEQDCGKYFKETVPASIEARSGEVSRQLKKAYETFDIEKQKEEKREKKIIAEANEHEAETSQRFQDENELIVKCFSTINDEIVAEHKRATRMEKVRYSFFTFD
jgi:hypothetical protein